MNLFLSDAEDEAPEAGGGTPEIEKTASAAPVRKQGELEIMIAEKDARRKGYGSQALKLIICYAMQKLRLGPENFLVRIGMDNESSIHMFERLGFEVVKTVEVFREVEMRIRKRTEHFRWLMEAEKAIESSELLR